MKVAQGTPIFTLLVLLTSFCSSPKKETAEVWQVLFDGSNLDAWENYLGPPQNPENAGMDLHEIPPVGLNNDSLAVFSIVNLDGENLLRISGELWGGLFTKQEFENFHLQLQFKWGDKKWYPRTERPRDSGLLYHAVGNHGDGDLFWMRSQEFQIQEGDCGDYWGVAGAMFDIRATMNPDSIYQYDPTGELLTFSPTSEYGRHCKKHPDNENPTGQWNTVDLYCLGSTAIHITNGQVNMILENSRQLQDNVKSPLTKGKIEIQSEAAVVYFKDIKIQPITKLPVFD